MGRGADEGWRAGAGQLYPEWPLAALRHLPTDVVVSVATALLRLNRYHPAVRARRGRRSSRTGGGIPAFRPSCAAVAHPFPRLHPRTREDGDC